MARKITCFVSFSAADAGERDVRFFLSHLAKELEEKVEFKVYFEQRPGADLQDFMSRDLDKADAILALFSPDYKRKADNAVPSGVRTEYMKIVDRLEEDGPDMPLFLPVLWIGSEFKAALPELFFNRHYTRDLHRFQAYGTDGKPDYLPRKLEADLKPDIDLIVAALLQRWTDADPARKQIQDEIDNAIFSEPEFPSADDVERTFSVKSERTEIPLETFSKNYFVQTAAYRAVGRYHKMAFTGRKGSGKTTLLKMYKYHNASRYFDPMDVEVNDWNLHYILGDMTFTRTESDLKYTEIESRIFDFIWPVFLSLSMVRSLEASDPATATLEDLLPNEIIRERYRDSKDRYDALFHLSVDTVREFFQSQIDAASTNTEGEFRRDLTKFLNVSHCIEWLLGPNFSGVANAITSDAKNRRMLFCLDRFDTEIQKYRKDLKRLNLDTFDRRLREAREVYWIQGLVEMIDHLRSPDYYSLNMEFYKVFGPHIDFCVPLPKDRLIEVQQRRRDSIAGTAHEEIHWQPLELLTLVRKRLQAIWHIDDGAIDKQKYKNARQRYDRVVELSGRRFPNNLEITINRHRYPIDLFLEVLRHTFFRPRDVVIYYSRIAGTIEAARTRNHKLTATQLSRVISRQTHRVVEDEFLGEFSDTVKNLPGIIGSFRASDQLLDLPALEQRLGANPFEMYGQDPLYHLGQKIRFLYEIGFLGVASNVGQLGSFPTSDYHFYFINSRVCEALEDSVILRQLRFAIHPVFIESLSLRVKDNAPVLYLDWDTIAEWDDFE